MINLIPPAAKKHIKREYAFRVATVWILLMTFSVMIGVAFTLPTLVLIKLQHRALASDSGTALTMQQSLSEVESMIKEANDLVKHLDKSENTIPYLSYVEKLEDISPTGVNFDEFTVREEPTGLGIFVSGVAADRQSLSDLVDAIEADDAFSEAKLPLDSLAATKNIKFSLTIIPAK